MFEVKDIIKKLTDKQPLTEQERFKIINSKRVKPELLQYLASKFENLTIEIAGEYEGKILDLMQRGLLEGWCWETTATSIIFFSDNDYIERGYLKFEEYKHYYHSWICFKYYNETYVFDPCLDLLCKKKLYNKVFEIEVKGKVTSKEVRDELLYRITHRKPRQPNWLDKYLTTELIKRLENETVISGNEDVNSPMYRNNTGYIIEFENNQIKKLIAHYYHNDQK